MSDVGSRLLQCFATVFPHVAPERITDAEIGKLEAWDSIASINLVAVVEEEFGIQIEITAMDRLTSFKRIAEYVREKTEGFAVA